MSRLRVINLGLPKTGTTTVARALRRACLHTADHRIRAGQTKDDHLKDEYVANLIYEAYYRTGDPLAYLDEFDAFSEISLLRAGQSLWPQMDFGIITAIRTHHPEAKFFASWRPVADISDSMLRWSNLGSERLPGHDQPGLPQGYGGADHERQRWISAHYDHLDQIFAGSDAYLRLDIRTSDARAQLAALIGRKVPWWGHANRNRTTPKVTPATDAQGTDASDPSNDDTNKTEAV